MKLVGPQLEFWVTESKRGCGAMARFLRRQQPASKSEWGSRATRPWSLTLVAGGKPTPLWCQEPVARDQGGARNNSSVVLILVYWC
jgi:hypothetical protein